MKYINLIITILLATSCSGDAPKSLGVTTTKTTGQSKRTLRACPETPNCITSYIHNGSKDHYMPPIKFKSFTSKARDKVITYLEESSNIKIIKKSDSYIYAEVTSMIFRFVDDMELYFSSEGVLHFRSASRIGRSDFGANKSHIKDIEKAIRKRY
jgi:uncharacterized protein (DUF1499 family)